MPDDELRLAGAFALSLAVALLATPIAIKVAERTGFHDHPGGYKKHSRVTPYLGGTAVMLAFTVTAFVVGEGAGDLAAIVGCALALCVVGTVDDRLGLGVAVRLSATAGCAAVLFATDLGWEVFDSDLANLVLTIVFVAGVVNAFNLMDNLDGATGAVTTVGASGVGVIAASQGDWALGVLAFALAGASAGFLPYNLAGPARVFLGDGGSMPLGLVMAALIMAMTPVADLGAVMVPIAVVLVGLPALDTALVIVSRRRRGVSVFSGGRDHLTHRLIVKLGSPRMVAVAIGLGQAICCAAALLFTELSEGVALVGSIAFIVAGIVFVWALEMPRWEPPQTSEESPA